MRLFYTKPAFINFKGALSQIKKECITKPLSIDTTHSMIDNKPLCITSKMELIRAGLRFLVLEFIKLLLVTKSLLLP